MSAVELLEYPPAKMPKIEVSGLYNLNRLIELCPDSMSPNDCLQKRVLKSDASVAQGFHRRQSDESLLQTSWEHLSQDTRNYLNQLIDERSENHYRQAHFDTLTYLPNRAYFQHKLHETILDTKDSAFTLMFLDLDGFKAVNDHFSHQVGDELLQLVSARLQSAVREQDFISRLGGDEFCIIVLETNPDHLETVCHRIISEVSRPYWIQSKAVHVSTSIGMAIYPQDAKFASDLINFADQALYYAKHQGKRQAHFYADIQTELEDVTETCDALDLSECSVELKNWSAQGHEWCAVQMIRPSCPLLDQVEEVFERLQSAKNLQAQTIVQWLWDSALYHLPAGKESNMVLQLSSTLLNGCSVTDLELISLDSSRLGIVMDEQEWLSLDSIGKANWQILRSVGVKSYCQVNKPWAFDWSLVESYAFAGIVMDARVFENLHTKPTTIRQVFTLAAEGFKLNLWLSE